MFTVQKTSEEEEMPAEEPAMEAGDDEFSGDDATDDMMGDIEGGDEASATQARKILRESVLSAAEVFAVKPYFLSDDFSLVDCTIAPILWRLPKYGIDVPEKQGKPILKYMERVFSRDAFQQSLSKVEKSIRP